MIIKLKIWKKKTQQMGKENGKITLGGEKIISIVVFVVFQ